MNHYADTIAFFFFWMIGSCLAMVVKMNDINNMQERLTLWKAAGEFLKYEYKSYLSSILVGVLYASFHDQIIGFMKNNGWTPDKIIEISGASPMLASGAYGFIFHYFGYKYVFGKLEKLYGQQIRDEQTQLKEENQQLKAMIQKPKPSDN